jgi:vacuolar-type H+-ATPase subunit H
MADFTSPLQAINRKESELRHRVEEARRRAEGQIQSVREEAKQTIAQANQKGQTEAKALYERGIEEARQEAEAIVDVAHEKATALRRQAAGRLDKAVRQIVELVLPVGVSPSEDVGLSSAKSALE